MRFLVVTVLAFVLSGFSSNPVTKDNETIHIFDDALFFDGYADLVDYKVAPEIIRTNTNYARKLTDVELSKMEGSLDMEVILKPACDNYDRIAHVTLALIEKGKAYGDNPLKLELGRFITPFMDKNKLPNEVPYRWNVDHIAKVFADKKLRAKYDFYMELFIGGVPYDAQKKIKGCEGRNDTFIASLSFVNSTPKSKKEKMKAFIPVIYNFQLNNYNGTDEIGKTIKEVTFEVDTKVKNAKMYLITSNHGANNEGEEYNRRNHFISIDGKEVLNYIPGEPSCEPYRIYNTQLNGIYRRNPQSDEKWQSFSNWCPGAIIPIRIIELGALDKGKHTFKIEVPDAKFNEQAGNIPTSVFIQG